MKKLFRLALLCFVCLFLLLGTDSFTLSAVTDDTSAHTLFSFHQTAPGIASVMLFGQDMTWNLTALLTFRETLGERLLAYGANAVSSVWHFCVDLLPSLA